MIDVIRDYFSYFLLKPYVVTPHLNCLVDSSDEGSQHMVSIRNKRNNPSVIIKYSLSRVLGKMNFCCEMTLCLMHVCLSIPPTNLSNKLLPQFLCN